ncbi:hypothetical protein [Rhizobium phaseoli]|uniref:hypothetical protein n=1 Tax=Rhizobium phaseoli TaxID=396 RepID=UPI0014384C2B|nr:hypothetical protein [Rhizobium phaseoli]MDK4726385.1 hypothetical protein [Rhizobium phaseoli]NKE89601.1 hypothetical protein [Rhizobium phaseoli]
MDAIKEFWALGRFPADFGGFRFLGKAVNEVGKATFGSDWTGLERSPPRLLMPDNVWGGIPSYELAQPQERLRIDLLLQQHRPDFGRPIPERGPFGPKVAPFTVEQWGEGIRLAQEHDAKSLAIQQRFAAVINTLVECLREGRMKSALRPEKGGDYSMILPPSSWNAEETIDCRFSLCRMHPIRQFSGSPAGDGYQLIFVDIEGLEKLLANLSPSKGAAIPISRRIIELKKSNPNLVRSEIAKQFPGLGVNEFAMHWKRAVELYPELAKAGRRSKGAK